MENYEMLKLEAIKNAYGELYYHFEQFMNSGGWSTFDVDRGSLYEQFKEKEINNDGTRWRPLSLTGLENNNGWTIAVRLEHTQPLDNGVTYEVINVIHGHCFNIPKAEVLRMLEANQISHYKPYFKSKLPVF